MLYHYQVTVTRVIDGDTFEGTLDLGFNVKWERQQFRLYGVDTPEVRKNRPRGVGPVQVAHGLKAKARVEELIGPKINFCPVCDEYKVPIPRTFTVRTHKDESGKYGRWLADVLLTEVPGYTLPAPTLSDLLRAESLVKRDNYVEPPVELW